MCTSITFNNGDCYFGRTLDLEYHYNEEIVITPRNYPFRFRFENECRNHSAIIGTATVFDGHPLYYEAVNEKGLCAAALNFPGNARFFEHKKDFFNIASFEFIPWILCNFENINEVSDALQRVNILNEPFSSDVPVTPLHWFIADKTGSLAVESVEGGLKVHSDPVGVLTNDPEFQWHMTNLSNYINLTADIPENRFSEDISLELYSKGLGSLGLPGDGSSASRFVRAAFTKLNSLGDNSEEENVSRFFHIMDSVSQTKGCIRLDGGKSFYTVYTSCYNADKGICYYTTYENRSVTSVDMNKEDLNTEELIRYTMKNECRFYMQNRK